MSASAPRPPHRARRLIAEAIGTFFLVLIGPGAATVNAYTAGGVGHVGSHCVARDGQAGRDDVADLRER